MMPFFTIMGIDHHHFSGIFARFTSGDPLVVNADLTCIKALMNNETTRHKAMGLANDDPPPHDSANRAQQPCALKKIPTGTVPDHTIVEYLPTCGVHWEFVTACHKAHKQRPYCYSTDLLHWKIGCP